ncbi:MAG: hypothetical protein JXA25_01710 [Anaerolineales bacterium]|nr:hypothetical protein [Anaerolineales bacterium]
MNKRGILIPLLVVFSTVACSIFSLPGSQDSPADISDSGQVSEVQETQTVEMETAIPADTAAPIIEPQAALLQRACTSKDHLQWCLTQDGAIQNVTPPGTSINYFDFAPASASILYGSAFPDHGGGPGEKAVSDLWVMDLVNGTMQQIVSTETVVFAYWAPNGSDFAYVRAMPDTYELVWHSGGTEKVLASDAHFVFDISSQGDQIAFTREPDMGLGPGMGLYVVDVITGVERKISDIDREGGGSISDQPHWSPDDSTILLPMIRQEGNIATLVAAADGSGSADLTFDPAIEEDLISYPLPNTLIWYPEGFQFLVEMYTGDMMVSGDWLLIKYTLDADQANISSAEIVAKDVHLVGWEIPGETVWLISSAETDSPPYLLTLP